MRELVFPWGALIAAFALISWTVRVTFDAVSEPSRHAIVTALVWIVITGWVCLGILFIALGRADPERRRRKQMERDYRREQGMPLDQ